MYRSYVRRRIRRAAATFAPILMPVCPDLDMHAQWPSGAPTQTLTQSANPKVPLYQSVVYPRFGMGIIQKLKSWRTDARDYSLITQFHLPLITRILPSTMSSQDQHTPPHVPRPSNSWIIFRSDYFQEQRAKATQQNSMLELNRQAAQLWHSMSEEARRPYKELADKIKAEHEVQHPDYRYSPRRKTGHRAQAPAPTSRKRHISSSQTSGMHSNRPTLSSQYPPPPLDGGYRDAPHAYFSRDSTPFDTMRIPKPSSSPEYAFPSNWDPTVTQLGLPSLGMSGSDSARHMPCDMQDPILDEDFHAYCHWNSDYSRP
ncbi:hypothetical protein GGX14DRAFT_663109 [Mycena pura]|uniref:HMG box domain-containing protein n=1 Tax=Mycena pura TaxID=153505 RepID=A0AAD6VTH4_9AGAR|nr:hypothetical protein GGX14DRAFT_663109 [Mycena pura]